MGVKNFNQGTIDTNGGNVHIGDIIEGLSTLLLEYKEQIKTIKSLLFTFQPRTALKLINELEERVNEADIEDNKISSKILYLKALCKSDLVDFSADIAAKDFIQAFNLSENDKEIRNRACVEYLNIDDAKKAIKLADIILDKDELNHNAWFVKILTSGDIKGFLKNVPKVVLENYFFKHSLIYQILRTTQLNFIEELNDYGLELNIEFDRYKELTYESKNAWVICIDLLISKIFNDYPIRFITGEDFILNTNPLVKNCISLIEKFTDKLCDTELKDSTRHQYFFYNYFKYFNTKEPAYLEELSKGYEKLPKPNWFYTLTYCQAINHQKDYLRALTVLDDFDKIEEEKRSEFYLFKATLLYFTNQEGLLILLLDSYLDSIDTINDIKGFNLLNTFFNILHKKFDDKTLDEQVTKILKKNFSSTNLKSIFEITIKNRYQENIDSEKVLEKIRIIMADNNFDHNYKNLICENLDNLGETKEALDYMNTYLDKSIISESLRFYIVLLEKYLFGNKESERGIYKELLSLLKFWRLNSKYPDENFAGTEHNLNLEKNDWDELKLIDYFLTKNFPENNIYKLFYLICLERLKLDDEFLDFADKLPEEYNTESEGIGISRLLLNREKTKLKGARILYKLASISTNTESRKLYFGTSHLFADILFKEYEIVENGVWVRFIIDNERIEDVQINKKEGFQNELLGKKVGDKFTIENKMLMNHNVIEIQKIYNDEIRVHFDIQREAQNPINDLGFNSFQVPEKIEDFEKFLIKQFGIQGNEERNHTKKYLDDFYNYRIGFSEVSRAVFKQNYVEAYLHLTEDKEHTYTTIPNLLVSEINTSKKSEVYILDFTSLMLFFNLEKNLGFKFKHKFLLSFLIKEHIEERISVEKNSPFSNLSVQVNPEGIKRFIAPDDYKENRIEYYTSILKWVENNCVIDLVEEKLDVSVKLKKNKIASDSMMKILVDNMHFSLRENNRLITNDSTLYLFQTKSGFAHNIVNPERYLTEYYTQKCDTEFYRFLLKSNYVGISINLDTIKNEFYAFISGKENYYQRCLQNLQYSIHNDISIIPILCKFLKELYLVQSITLEHKNRYSIEVIKSSFYGMPVEIINEYERLLKKEFILLGDSYEDILISFNVVKRLFFPNQ
tara:strand:+ start:722 stop:4120 length:3399 start_codon:yes stop_codon:yes gene_type:complete